MNHKFYYSVIRTILILSLSACNLSPYPNRTPEIWSLPINGYGTTLLVGNKLAGFVIGESGRQLAVIDLDERELMWTSEELWGGTSRPIIVTDEKYIYGDSGSRLMIYSPSGEIISSTPHPGIPDSNLPGVGPVLDSEVLYVPNGRWLYTYDISDPGTPELLWSYQTPRVLSGLDIDMVGDIYIAHHSDQYEDNLLKLEKDTGNVMWRSTTTDERLTFLEFDFASHIVIVEDKLIVDARTHMFAFDLETGEQLWLGEPLYCGKSRELEGPGSQPAYGLEVVGDTLYRNCDGGAAVMAVSATNGSVLWIFDAAGSPFPYTFGGTPKYYEGKIYSSNGDLWTLNAKTGKVLSLADGSDLSIRTRVQVYQDQVFLWGEKLIAYRP